MINSPQESQQRKVTSLYADDPEMRDLIIEFVREMPQRIQLADAAFIRGDRPGLQRWAHQLKGGAGSYGFHGITDCAADLEQTILSNKSTDVIFDALRRVTDLCELASATQDEME